MIIEILNSNLRKVDVLRKYTFAQYTEMLRDIGTFTITAQNVSENLYLLDVTEQYYILFDGTILGRVDKISKADEDETLNITGQLITVIFNERVITKTIKYTGYSYAYIQNIIQQMITGDTNSVRYIPINVKCDDEDRLTKICSNTTRQTTGGYIWDVMKDVFVADNYGCIIRPNLVTRSLESTEPNIDSFDLTLVSGTDHRKNNTDGNTAVIFSQSLSNLMRTEYSRDTQDYKNAIYIAGEDSGSKRKWFSYDINEDIVQKKTTGVGRRELWLDARDIQSTKDDGSVMSDSEYEALIKQRALDRSQDNTVVLDYEATLTQTDRQYKYGSDYQLGDWVTILDNSLGLSIDAQVVAVTASITNSQVIHDVTFSYGNSVVDKTSVIRSLLKRVNELQDTVRVLEKKVGV